MCGFLIGVVRVNLFEVLVLQRIAACRITIHIGMARRLRCKGCEDGFLCCRVSLFPVSPVKEAW